ncbi:MAG: hypothetical protein V7640_2797, partial [Betaproteobacteria bacterium]
MSAYWTVLIGIALLAAFFAARYGAGRALK